MPRPVHLLLKGQTFDSLLSVLLGHFFPETMNAIGKKQKQKQSKGKEIRKATQEQTWLNISKYYFITYEVRSLN